MGFAVVRRYSHRCPEGQPKDTVPAVEKLVSMSIAAIFLSEWILLRGLDDQF
jgi:hypothetical protein